jgi:ABC-type lipoprotein export system ATPase subunit
MELLHQLHRDGSTICMVTHDPRFAQHAERGINLFDGQSSLSQLKQSMQDRLDGQDAAVT